VAKHTYSSSEWLTDASKTLRGEEKYVLKLSAGDLEYLTELIDGQYGRDLTVYQYSLLYAIQGLTELARSHSPFSEASEDE